jgi:DNA-binding PadR family transcriptional regulator
MFRHVVLGLLRDEKCRHGYDLMREHRARTGSLVNSGNFYRELAHLSADGLIVASRGSSNTDARRIPYRITAAGVREFDDWLAATPDETDQSARLMFIDRLPHETVGQLLDRWQRQLLRRARAFERARDEAAEQASDPEVNEGYNLLPTLIFWRMKQNTAELDFVKELRRNFEAWNAGRESLGGRGRVAHGRKRS